jgi:hypothetical protein
MRREVPLLCRDTYELVQALSLNRAVSRSPIVQIFVREGVFYFLAVAGVNVLNAAFMFQKCVDAYNVDR